VHGPGERRQGVFTEDCGNRWPLLEECQHRFDATPHAAQKTCVVEVGSDTIGGEHAQRLDQTALEDLIDLRKAAVELLAVQAQAFAPGGARLLVCARVRWHAFTFHRDQAKVASIA
jgi:hypothetical protein